MLTHLSTFMEPSSLTAFLGALDNPYAALLLVSALVCGLVALFAWQRRPAPGAGALTLLLGAVAVWATLYAGEIAAPTLAAKLVWARAQYLAVVTIAPAWLAFALAIAGRSGWLSRPLLAGLAVEPLVMLAIALGSGVPGPLYRTADLVGPPDFVLLHTTKGPAFWAHALYSYLLLLAGTVIFAQRMLRTRGVFRRQAALSLLAVALPWAANAVHLSGFSPLVDLTPFAFTLAGAALAWALVHFQLLDLVPVARDVVIEGMRDGILVFDGHRRIVDANPAACLLLGRRPDDTVGQPAATVLAAHPDVLAGVAASGEVQGEIRVDTPAGPRPCALRVSPLTDRRGAPGGRLVVLRDITDEKRVQAELERAIASARDAARAKSDFLATMSHEIRTPLNGVIGMTSVLLDSRLTADQQECVQTIRRCGEALLTIVSDILDFSKIESGRLDLEQVPFDLHDCVRSCLDMTRPAAAAKGLALTCHVVPDAPAWVCGDVTRLRQILLNLLSNAIKFTPGGAVELRVALGPATDGRAELSMEVRDTGIGIAADRLAHVFEPFTQADAGTTRHFGGTGLGLAISRRLAALMGGTLTAESTPGRGSTFALRVPVDVVAPPAAPGPACPLEGGAPAADGRILRILVAEDNRVNQRVALRMLELLGYRADVAGNGCEAVAAVLRQPYDVILMDVRMPEMDGLAATRRIRALSGDPERPWIIALTASATAEDRDTCLAAGMNAFLTKPVRRETLATALAGARTAAAVPAADG